MSYKTTVNFEQGLLLFRAFSTWELRSKDPILHPILSPFNKLNDTHSQPDVVRELCRFELEGGKRNMKYSTFR